MANRWQVVQRSRTWLFSTTSFSAFTCHTSPPSGFSFCDRSVTFVSKLGFFGQELPQHRRGGIHVERVGLSRPFLQEGLDRRGTPLGDQATGVFVVLVRR